MHSGRVNAAPLLASFLGSENEKIGQNIAQGDFSGELQKLMPATAKGAGSSARNAPAKPEKADAADSGLKASAGETPAAAETKSSTSPSTRERRGAEDSRTKINAIKSKAQKEQSLVVSNPGIAQTVLADLQYPAQTRKACEGMQNKEGQISIKDLRALLGTQGATDSEISGQVPADHASALVESIISKASGTNLKESASGGTLPSSVQMKTEGSYSPSEFRGLLDKVLQQVDTAQSKVADTGSQPGSAKTAEGLKTGQTESLVETVLPSFISANHEHDSTRKIFAGNSNDQTSEAQSAKVRDIRENSVETVSDNLKSGEQLSAAEVASGGKDKEWGALVTEAETKDGGTGSSTSPASDSPSARQETGSIPLEALDPVLKYFDARIVSESLQQPEVNTASTPAPGGPDEASAAQAQNLAPSVKGVEKQADGPSGTLSSSRLAQDMAEQTEAALTKTMAAESASGDRSSNGNPNRQDFNAQASAVLQNLSSGFQGSETNLSQMPNSTQSGFAYFDPYRSVELAENAREQVTSGAARHLVLEMEPDELGKISIKVGANKDGISVEAHTQSEPARQILMRHSPELRQDLQNQGLVLEKFTVDVNGEKSGGGNYHEENNPKGKTPPVSKTAGSAGIQAATEPSYISETDGQWRISIFA
jgi:flagellar hook-length control protein FliK